MTTTPVTTATAAVRIGIKPWPIYELTESGRLPYVKIPGHVARIVAIQDVRVLIGSAA